MPLEKITFGWSIPEKLGTVRNPTWMQTSLSKRTELAASFQMPVRVKKGKIKPIGYLW